MIYILIIGIILYIIFGRGRMSNDGFEITEIIKDKIYLGNINGASNYSLLKKYKIDAIINSAIEIPNFFPNDFTYFNVPIYDGYNQEITKYFNDTNLFIKNHISKGKRVFIHCHAGISRSASILTAYLLSQTNMNLNETLTYLRSKRSIVNPNKDFYKNLSIYEKNLIL